MGTSDQPIDDLLNRGFAAGFVSDVAVDTVPPGLSEAIIQTILARKQEPDFLLEWRLKAWSYWRPMPVPQWSNVHYPPWSRERMTNDARRLLDMF